MNRKKITYLCLILFSLVAFVLLIALPNKERASSSRNQNVAQVTGTADLLRDGQWSFLPGATKVPGGLRVANVGLALVHPNGSFAEDNPPVNLYGTRLAVDGDFAISATLGEQRGEGSVTLYGRVPVVLDEQRYEDQSVRMTMRQGSLHVQVTSGQDGALATKKTFIFSSKSRNQVTLVRSGGLLAFSVNGQKLGSVPEHDVFASKQLWFGFEAAESMLVSDLRAIELGGTIQVIDASSLRISEQNPHGLQRLADTRHSGLTVGTAVSLEPLVSDAAYSQLLGSGWFGAITTENALKAVTVHPLPNVYNFAGGDALVDFAKRHSLKVHGHALVFGEANPLWMRTLAKDRPEQLEAVMTEHITTVMTHYRGQMASWDVVNESFGEHDLNRKNIWYQAMGEAYIAKAFRAARQADPNARLFINEYGLEGSATDANEEKWENFLAMLDRQHALGVPIDGVGLQMHIDTPDDLVDPYMLRSRIRQLADRGLLVRISEMDVYGDNERLQARQFADVLRACIEEENCVEFATWGVGEGNGATAWVADGQLHTAPNLPFDAGMHARAAAEAMQRALTP